MEKRSPDLAGSWYPARASECRRLIQEFSATEIPRPATAPALGGIVPHAGWFYSGRIAANVIERISATSEPDTVVIAGRHLHAGSPCYIMKEGLWATPLGDLEIDAGLAEGLMAEFAFTVETATDYEQDNTIELQLPFIRYFLADAKILPIGIPPSPAAIQVGEAIVACSETLGRKIAILGSTDLTHYGSNYGYAPKGAGPDAVDWVRHENDRRIVELMLSMDPEGVLLEASRNHNACCSGAAAAAIAASQKLGAKRGVKLVYSTSYDTRPDSSFVGYTGIIFE
jgi:AmmeMemoRadiSam system protein B